MATISDCVTRTKRLLNSNTRTELDAVETAMTADGTTLHLKYQTDGIRAGSYISVEDGTNLPETMYVHSRNGEYATVQRQVDGSGATGGTAWSAGSTIEVEPRFSGHQILESVKDAIRFMPNNLYGVSTASVSFSDTTQSVACAEMNDHDHGTPGTGFLHVLSATRTARSSEDRLLSFNVTVQRQTDKTYKVIRQEGLEKAVTCNIIYAHPFDVTTLNLNTDLETTVGMSSSMQDIPTLGAGLSLILGEESLRLDLHAQGDSRGDTALAAGDRTRYSMILQAQYDRRVSEESRRLMSLYGIRSGASASSVFPTTLR
tara:strand:+ start:825 stop:1772 length:948 start_codon:yes stop_codon:yes gene_type:complete